jgi:ribonuclease III
MTGMAEPVVVFRTHSEVEASVVRGLLDSHGIRALASWSAPHAILPMAVRGLGEVRIAVHPDEADEARRVIESHRQGSDHDVAPPLGDEFLPLERRLGYRFRDRGLLEHALTHRSRAHEDVTGGVADNESLEFLGDAVVGFLVADLLFREFPDFDEGQKSKIKASLVSTPALARVGERLDLGGHLLLGRGEEKTGGRHKQALLADATEALLAALYLDGGIDVVRAFVERELGPLAARARQPGMLTALTGDYKSALQEFLQARDEPPPAYRLVGEAGPDHRKSFEVEVSTAGRVLGRADGSSKKEAEQAAAREALSVLGVDLT